MLGLTPPGHGTCRLAALATLLAAALAGCGGSGSNPLDNPALINNPLQTSGQTLSYVYFQRCINPIFLAQLAVVANGVSSSNSCAGAGCHDNTSGTGGAFRVLGAATPLDLSNAANTPDVIRASDMYKNFYSAQGEVVIGAPTQSRLLAKPLLLGVLHGGGLIFASDTDANLQLLRYWITHPVPLGQDEFSTAAASMFTPADAATGSCNTQ